MCLSNVKPDWSVWNLKDSGRYADQSVLSLKHDICSGIRVAVCPFEKHPMSQTKHTV